MKKIVSLLLVCCFINLIASDIYANIFMLSSNSIPSVNNVMVNNFVPVDLGKMVENIYVAGDKTIINIQDLHSDETTQKNIALILDFLVNNYDVKNIYLEGAIGDLDVSWLNVINNKSVIERFMHDGKITGVEYFALTNKNKNIKFKGLEEKSIYKENFEILAELYSNKIEIQNEISQIQNELNASSGIYNYKIKQLNYLNKEYKQNNVDMREYYSYLIKFAKKKSINVSYKTISKYLELNKLFNSINSNKLKEDLLQIDSMLKSSLKYEQYVQIQQLQSKYPNQYYEELLNFIVDNKVDYKYEEFIKFCNCLNEKNSIDAVSLLQEETDLLNKLYETYAKTSQEKTLLFLSNYTEKLSLFLTNNLTASDYIYIKNNFNKYCALVENYISKVDVMKIRQWYKLADKFYSNNEKRNKTFIESICNKKISQKDFINDTVIKNDNRMSFEKILEITKQPIDIMITGGYHSQGLKELMAELDINYAIVLPNIDTLSTNESRDLFYKDYQKQYSIILNTYQKFIRSSLMNEQWTDPTKIIIGAFIDYSLLDELYKDLQNTNSVEKIVTEIQNYLVDIFNKKGMNCNLQLSNIETIEDNSFVVTVLDNGKERMFFISQDIVKEISDKSEIKNLVSQTTQQQEVVQPKKKISKTKKILRKITRFFTIVLLMPLTMVMGGGVGISSSKSKKELTDNGANINVVTPEIVNYTDTMFDQGAQVSLDGNITLSGIHVGKDNKLNLKAGKNTKISIENIDIADIGELDITIEADGEFKIVKENSIIKVYKVLRTDFTVTSKKRLELVSMLEKGKLFVNAEQNWEQTNDKPIVVFYKEGYSGFGNLEKVKAKSELIYKNCNVIYINVSDISKSFFSSKFEMDINKLKEILKSNNIDDKDICIDTSVLEDSYLKGISDSLDLFAKVTNSTTLLYTNIPHNSLFPSSMYLNRPNRHNYLNQDGSYIRYPCKDRNWLRNVLTQYFPSFNNKTFIFVWPVESAKHTYIPNEKFGGTPEERVSAFEPFKEFMDKAREYATDNKDAIVFLPRYLMSELATYLENPKVANDFIDVVYGENKSENAFNIWYKTQTTKDLEKIELLKIDNLTVVMYPEGNRGHNEQAYLETLLATYNFGKDSLDLMLTQAGFTWKANTIYVFEGKEMQDLNMEQKLLQNPSIKKGKVSYVYDNLKRVFINLYSDMKKFFISIIPKYTKGNWVAIENKVRTEVDINKIREALTAKSKLGFDSVMVVPVQKALLDDMTYGYPTILEQDGIEIPVYCVGSEDGTIYLVGVSDENIKWQQAVLPFIKDSLHDYKNNIVSFSGIPQMSSKQTVAILGELFIPVVINENPTEEKNIEDLGYDTIVDVEDIVSRIGNEKLKYPHVAEDMLEITETIKVIKALKKKSFFGQFEDYKTSYVGTKIASDEHIFNSEMEENEFIEILKGTDIDFVTVVIRDNDLGVHVLNRQTTVKENLTRLSQSLHQNNKKVVLEYTFRFIDEFFKTFTRTIKEDCNDIGVDGIKLDLANCGIDDIKKAIEDLRAIRAMLTDLDISVQVSNEVWNQFSALFNELNITRTVSSKEELLIGEHDLSAVTDVNYEISIYKDQQDYEHRMFRVSTQRDRLLDKNPEDVPESMRTLLEQGEARFLDQIIDRRLETIFQKVVTNKSIGKLIIPVNMLYAQRLKDNENSNVIQAVSNLIRLFKEAKGMAERRKFAYEFGLQQNIKLTQQQREEIEQLLRGEAKCSAGNYVRRNFPFVFDYFVESRQTRIEISDSFLFGIYEADIIRRYKEGEFGKVLQFVVDKGGTKELKDQNVIDETQKLFYRLFAQAMLYKDKQNIKDILVLEDKDYISYVGGTVLDNYLSMFTDKIRNDGFLYSGIFWLNIVFDNLSKTAIGYMPDREKTVYQARLLMKGLLKVYKTEEIEPILPVIEDNLKLDDSIIMDENISVSVNRLLASA